MPLPARTGWRRRGRAYGRDGWPCATARARIRASARVPRRPVRMATVLRTHGSAAGGSSREGHRCPPRGPVHPGRPSLDKVAWWAPYPVHPGERPSGDRRKHGARRGTPPTRRDVGLLQAVRRDHGCGADGSVQLSPPVAPYVPVRGGSSAEGNRRPTAPARASAYWWLHGLAAQVLPASYSSVCPQGSSRFYRGG